MLRSRYRYGVFALVIGLTSISSYGADFFWVPIEATGSHSIDGNMITLQGGGQTVTLEMKLSGWDPEEDGPPLGAYQFTIDGTGYSSGNGDPLVPTGWPATPANGAFIDSSRTDYVFNGVTSIPAVATITLDYEYGAVIMGSGKTDGGLDYYAGTLLIDVPAGANGVYTIDVVDNDSFTFIRDEIGFLIEPLDKSPAIIFVACISDANCADGNLCTDDDCLPSQLCDNPINYDDSVECCDPTTGNLEPLDDDNDCTDDVCNTADGSVSHDPMPEGTDCGGPPLGPCDAQDTCNASAVCIENFASAGTPCGSSADTDCTDPDTCDGSGGCDPNDEPFGTSCGDPSDTDCTDPDTCNSTGTCLANHADNGDPCDDGLFCTIDEACLSGACSGGSFACDDDVSCTDDTCDDVLDVCYNEPNDANCDNGQWCDGVEICDPIDDCVISPGTVPDCDDLVDCTDDSCDDVADVCRNIPNDANCDNGLWCDGFEWCDPIEDCQDGTEVDCDDEIDCTSDSCNDIIDECVNTPNHEECPDDGLFCNGDEICVVGVGCDHSGNPCGGPCDEELDTCLCDAPIVEAAGPRYLAVSLQPPDSEAPQAIMVRGACTAGIARYVGAPVPFELLGYSGPTVQAGVLVDDPADAVFLTPAEWGDPVYITGESVTPATQFEIWADCGWPGNPAYSDMTTAWTWKLGDVDNNTVVNFTDVLLGVEAFKGNYLSITLAGADLHDCVPNLLLNMVDILWTLMVFQGRDADSFCPDWGDCPMCYPVDCDDDSACTDDSCDIETGDCINELNYNPVTRCCDPDTGVTTMINDSDPCTIDVCDPDTGEVSHNPMVCNDGDDCTLDECVAGSCEFTDFTTIVCDDNSDCPPESAGCAGHCTCPDAPAARMIWRPVESDGAYTLNDNEIIIPPGGAQVTIELHVANWDPDHNGDPLLEYFATGVSEGSFTSGSTGMLGLAEIPCEGDEDCSEPNHVPPSSCEGSGFCDAHAAYYVDPYDPDYVFFDLAVIPVANPVNLYIASLLTGNPVLPVADTGAEKYAGTLIVDVSSDASGTFTIGFNPDTQVTVMGDGDHNAILPITLIPGLITISGP